MLSQIVCKIEKVQMIKMFINKSLAKQMKTKPYLLTCNDV